MKSKIKLIIIQALLFSVFGVVAAVIFIEIPAIIAKKQTKSDGPTFCKNHQINESKFLYLPCPGTSYTKSAGRDSATMQPPLVFIDQFGGRKSHQNRETDILKNKPKILIVGDSFVEADEVKYFDTFYGLINAKNDPDLAYAHGFRSWNPLQYLESIKAFTSENSFVDVYLYPNDFFPTAGRSVYAETLSGLDEKTNSAK